jgi:ribonucleoside-diphosphate reductase alpha chain
MSKHEELSLLRKKLQAEGSVPSWYTTQGLQMFLQSYHNQGEDCVKGRFATIAKVSRHLPPAYRAEYEEKFFNLMWEQVLSPSSPALANTGTPHAHSVACAGQYINDSVDSFYTNLHETAMLTKYAFGTSGYFGDIRPRGTPFGYNGKANGIEPVIDDYFQCAANISQDGIRKGSFAAYVPIEHPDFDDCMDSLLRKPTGKNYGWIINDAAIASIQTGNGELFARWQRLIHTKLVTGKGYILFIDKVNRNRPKAYVDNGLYVVASNLCVAGDTTVLTDQGHIPIKSMVGKSVNVWNGEEWSNVTIRQTGTNQQLVRVTTDSGQTLDCTAQHHFYTQNSYSKSAIKRVAASELNVGDKLIKWTAPVVAGYTELSSAYENGFYSADGCTVGTKARIYLYAEKQKLLPLFSNISNVTKQKERTYFYCNGLQDKYFVPTAEHTVDARLKWLAGYLDGDGCLLNNKGSLTIQVASVNPVFLRKLQMLLMTLGAHSKIKLQRKAGSYLLPANDGTGELKYYPCQQAERLLISGNAIQQLMSLGLTTYRLQIPSCTPQREATKFVKVASVEPLQQREDTYCFTEPKRHMGVFNGILTGQCNEIRLFSDAQHTFSCILSSINLLHWDRIKRDDSIFTATVFLDCLTSEFLEKSKNDIGLHKVREFTRKGRAVGLGVMGFHTYLQSKMLAYDSIKAHQLNNAIFSRLQSESLSASRWLAEILGEPEWCKGTGERMTHRTAIAPTKSTALLMGGMSESTFADPGMAYTSSSAVGELARIPPMLYKLMLERGVYSAATVSNIVSNLGSVQHVDWLNKEEKAVFKTAFELSPWNYLVQCKARQKYICQGQSINFHIAEETSEIVATDLLSACMDDPDIDGVYYLYTRSGVIVQGCSSCEG